MQERSLAATPTCHLQTKFYTIGSQIGSQLYHCYNFSDHQQIAIYIQIRVGPVGIEPTTSRL